MKRAFASFCLLGNLPVLAERALEIASDCGHRKREGAGKEMKEWFFFDRIYVGSDHFAIDMGEKCALNILPNSANPELRRGNQTPVLAEKTCCF